MWALKKYLTVLGAISLSLLITSCGGNSQSSSANNSGNPSATAGTSNSGSSGSGNSSGTGPAASSVAVSYVYVGNSSLSGGTISGFAVNADGSATEIASTSSGGGSLATNDHFLLASDPTNITSFTIGSGGTLTKVNSVDGTAHNDTPSGSAVGSLSMDRMGHSLYAGEINFQGTDNGGYEHFEVGSDGKITWVDNAGISADFGSTLTFSQDNQFAYGHGCYFLTFGVEGFSRGSNGTLTAISSNAQPPQAGDNLDLCPGASTASPKSNYLVSVITPVGSQGGDNLLVTYQIHSDGTLSLSSQVTTAFTAIYDVAFDPSGTYVAAATNAGVQIYSASSTGMLTPVGSAGAQSVTFNGVQWDSKGHLFGLSNSSNALYIFNVSNGTAAGASGSPHAVNNPGAMAVAAAQ